MNPETPFDVADIFNSNEEVTAESIVKAVDTVIDREAQNKNAQTTSWSGSEPWAEAGTEPFGESESKMKLKGAFPILYEVKEKDFIQIRSAVAFHYTMDDGASAVFSSGDEEEYVTIWNGAQSIPKELTNLDIKEKDIIKIGDSPKIKVDKSITTTFQKLTLASKIKIGKASELNDDEIDWETVKGMTEATKDAREIGIQELANKLKGGMTTGKLSEFLKTYAFKKHVLVTGPAGHGKTYIVDKFANEYGVDILFKSLDEGTESIDLLGHLVKISDGSFVWKDGIVTEAFRLAKDKKVILFIDEMLRAPVKELNILIGSMTPNSNGEYVLRTGRPMEDTLDPVNKIIKEEIIKVPMSNLWLVSTTNQGAGYNTGRIDRALKDRFRLFYQESSREETEDIVYDKALSLLKTESTAKNLTTVLMSIMDEISEMRDTGNIPEVMSLRHISEVMDTSSTAREIKSRMLNIAPNIVSITSDGKFNQTQLDIINEIIKSKL